METTAVRLFPFLTVSLKACSFKSYGDALSPASALGYQWNPLSSLAHPAAQLLPPVLLQGQQAADYYYYYYYYHCYYYQYEAVQYLQAISGQILTPLQKGLRIDSKPKRRNLLP